MSIQSVFAQMLNDAEIVETYSFIAKQELALGGLGSHGFDHINRVIKNCQIIGQLLKLNDDDIAAIKLV